MTEIKTHEEYIKIIAMLRKEHEEQKIKHDEELTEAKRQIEALKEILVGMSDIVEGLEARLNKNSKNSSKPPSSDGYGKGSNKNSRVKSDKPSGGQKGREGKTLNFSNKIDKIIEIMPKPFCDNCGGDVILNTENYVMRQKVELGSPKKLIIEYHGLVGICEQCGKKHKGIFPEDIQTPVSFGENLRATLTYLTQYQFIPLKRTTELMQDLFGIKLSQGTIVNANQEAYEALEEVEEQIREELIGSEVVHFDETGMRVNKELQWLHSAGTDSCTLYTIHKRRGLEAMDEQGVLPKFIGVAVHDHWKSYYHYMECTHAECNAHHIRHLRYLFEDLKQDWAGEMICLLIRIKRHVELSKDFGIDSLEAFDLVEYERLYNKILMAETKNPDTLDEVIVTQKKKKTDSERMLKRMLDYSLETLAFMYDFNVPFDNNLAERDVRMPKTKQKISGCFRSEGGAKAFARTRSFISTVRKKGKNVIEGLFSVFTNSSVDFLYLDQD